MIVAASKGEVMRPFERDATRIIRRRTAAGDGTELCNGYDAATGHSAVCFNLIPSVGEYFILPARTTAGPCKVMVFEGLVGGPMDCWRGVRSRQEHLARSIGILETFLPWEVDRTRESEVTDANGILIGGIAPGGS